MDCPRDIRHHAGQGERGLAAARRNRGAIRPGLLSALLLAAALRPLPCPAQNEAAQPYDLFGWTSENQRMDMELWPQPDGSVKGYYLYEAVGRPYVLRGTLNRRNGQMRLRHVDARCNTVGLVEGTLRDQQFDGTLRRLDHSVVTFSLSQQRPALAASSGNYRCEIKKGQFASRAGLAIERGTLEHFSYITNFIGGVEKTPWYCAIDSSDPHFVVESESDRISLSDRQRNGCRVVIASTGDLIKIRFRQCAEFCSRANLPHALLIDKNSGRCTEYAMPQGECAP